MKNKTLFLLISLFISLSISNGCTQIREKPKDNNIENKTNVSTVENKLDTSGTSIENIQNNINIDLGLPTDADSTDDFLIYRTQYVLSFNKYTHNANWVSWNLNSGWYGDEPRQNQFTEDPLLPNNIQQATDNDYKNSGYDRGHILRSEERTRTKEDNITTFYYTNMMPQTPDLNRGVWLKFERYCEKLCKEEDKELYIIAGGIYHNGYGVIGDNIAVPDSCFKIVVILDKGARLKDVNTDTKIIAVVMPNIEGVRKDNWQNYTTSVRRIEWSTGYNYLSNVSKEIQDIIEK
jgi:endonuclease G, mitochondrial